MLPSRSCQNLNIESIVTFFEFQFIFGGSLLQSCAAFRTRCLAEKATRSNGDPSICLVQPYYRSWERRERPIQKLYHTISVIGIACRGSWFVVRNFACGWTSYYASHDIFGSLLRGVQRKSPCLLFVARTFSRHENFSLRMGACHIVEDLLF